MNKKLLIFLAMALMVIPAASACGRTTALSDQKFLPMPHVEDVRFRNCNVCHANDQLNLTTLPFDHTLYTFNNCTTQAGCHKYTPPKTTTTPTPTTTGTTTSTGGTGTATTATTSAPPATLSEVGIAITTHNKAVMAAYKGLCMMCHGQGLSNSNPYPPTWDGKASGSTHNTGVYVVVPGSKADHTGFTNETDCTQAGCHAPPTS